MATYATYRHIELDKVGHSKKRVRNPPSDILNVICTPPSNHMNGSFTSRRSLHDNSFKRLFGTSDSAITPSRKSSLPKTDVTTRNPVTGDGVISWDCRPDKKSPRVLTGKTVVKQRNPVTGEFYTIISPTTTPVKQNGLPTPNGSSTPILNGSVILTNGNNNITTNGQA
ncbi:uncharacterized protein [Onthophagus taurus]|uniref:uncharacterized protein n=1 Tax=Onthophagus taurus TaxID=166361 RepID=UPI000C200A46|nr:uncharacterized protein LOC111423817 [Onthophagus taurus]